MNAGLEGKRIKAIFPNEIIKHGWCEFVDDTGQVFIQFCDKTYLSLTADQAMRAREEGD